MKEEIKQRIELIKNGQVPQGYKTTKVGIIPEDWEVKKAKKIFKNISDKNHNGKLNVLSSTQDRGIIPRNELNIDIKYNTNSLNNYKKVEKGDFVISLRSFQGGIEYSNYTGIISPAYTIIRENYTINKVYYKEYFKSYNYIKRLNSAIYGIRDGKQINYNDFGIIELFQPPFKEQQKIADILTTQDKLIELKQKLIEEKEKQKKYLMKNLLTGKIRLKGFNDKWRKIELKEITEVITGKTPSTKNLEFYDGEYIWVTPTDINSNKYIYNTNKTLTNEGAKKCKILPKETVLITCIASIGKNTILKVNGCCNQQINAILPNKNLCMEYIYYLMCFNKNLLMKYAGKSATQIINKETFTTIPINLPPLQEQNAIAEILSKADEEIELLKRDLEQEKEKKKALIQLLLTGIVRI